MIRIINALSKNLLNPSTFSFCAKATENKSAKIVQLFTDKGIDENKERPITNGICLTYLRAIMEGILITAKINRRPP